LDVVIIIIKNSKENNAETPDGTIYALAICGQH
jgi:hypothetical protein